MNIWAAFFIFCNMSKLRFKVFKFRRWAVNLSIAIMLFIVAGTCVIAGSISTPAMAVSGVYYSGSKDSNKISLMINVYWGSEYLDDMLATLKEKNVKTTFFVGGTWAVLNENYLKKIYEDGHEIANHGYHHKDHDKISEQENLNEIKNTHTIIKELLGIDMNLFAPPSGAYDKTTVSCAALLGYKTIMWTRDTIDWRDHNADLIYNRAIKNAKGGDLVLMHPTEATAKALGKIIDYLQGQKFVLTTVSDNIALVAD